MTSIWSHKPWWCQPWTILLTGVVVIGLSWFVIQLIWFTAFIALGVMAWWLLFLVLVPKAYLESQTESPDSSE
ncbi:MAG: hypothetical protein CMN91_00830 [Synechococcus sp. ARS1019]|nr:hypothetical protein [Synechococcus sp. ARS1019]